MKGRNLLILLPFLALPAAAAPALVDTSVTPPQLVMGDLPTGEAVGPLAIRFSRGPSALVSRSLPAFPEKSPVSAGQRVALHGATGPLCRATVDGARAVRWNYVSAHTLEQLRAMPPTDGWGPTEMLTGRFVVATLRDIEGDCAGALVALPADTQVKRRKVTAAPEWVARAASVFLESGAAIGNLEKIALEGPNGNKPPQFLSVRRLGPPEGPAFALLYGKVNGSRVILVHHVPTADLPGRYVTEIYAESPSDVLALDTDGDGREEVLVGHPTGVAWVPDQGPTQVVEGGVLR